MDLDIDQRPINREAKVRNLFCIKSLVTTAGKNISRFIFAPYVAISLGLIICAAAQAGTHATGNSPSNGATTWAGCASCHVSATNLTGIPPDNTVFGNTFAATSNPGPAAAACVAAANCPNQTVAYYATNPANITTKVTAAVIPEMAATIPSATSAADLSAYFASLQTPVLVNPANASARAGTAYSLQIASSATSDYLVSTTTFAATGLPAGLTISSKGLISGTLPNLAATTIYSISVTATNVIPVVGTTHTSSAVTYTLTVTPTLVAPAVMQIQPNTSFTLDMATYISGSGITGISIVVFPNHGTVSVYGTKATYTPNTNYFGTDSFSYQAYGPSGVPSPSPATVSITISGRPDPASDNRVTGLVNTQSSAAIHFGTAQILNFQQRLESRHQTAYSSSNTSALSDHGGLSASSGNMSSTLGSA